MNFQNSKNNFHTVALTPISDGVLTGFALDEIQKTLTYELYTAFRTWHQQNNKSKPVINNTACVLVSEFEEWTEARKKALAK